MVYNRVVKLGEVVTSISAPKNIKDDFARRISNSETTKHDNLEDHFCIMFLAYDPEEKKYIIGHHKK